MFVFGNFLSAIAYVLDTLLGILFWLIIIRALISWVNPDPNNVIVQLLLKVTEPVLYPIRRIMPLNLRIGIDISPIIAILIIKFLQYFVLKLLFYSI